jgi:hypothetical protein
MDAIFNLMNSGGNNDKNGTKDGNSIAKKAENFWSMLNNMAESDPDGYRKFIDKTLKEGKEMMKPPEAHMCIKTILEVKHIYIQ